MKWSRKRFGWYAGAFDSPVLNAFMEDAGWRLTVKGFYAGKRGVFWIRRSRSERYPQDVEKAR